jgi:hypothetical protein
MGSWPTVGVAAAVVVVFLVAYLTWVVLSNRRAGARGLVRRDRLICPKCHGSFDHALVPGASATSLRLGTGRYMACPLCHRWSIIQIAGASLAESTEPSPASPPSAP